LRTKRGGRDLQRVMNEGKWIDFSTSSSVSWLLTMEIVVEWLWVGLTIQQGTVGKPQRVEREICTSSSVV
jgi:hypothetical protein